MRRHSGNRTWGLGLATLAAFAAPSWAAELAALEEVRPAGDDRPAIARYSERTLVVAFELDRDGVRPVGFTVKPRPYLRETTPAAIDLEPTPGLVQLEVVLGDDTRFTHRLHVGPMCLDHGPDAEPHVAGDTFRLHRESYTVELPERAGLDRIEMATYERYADASGRRGLGEFTLDRTLFRRAGGELGYADLAFARAGGGGDEPLARSRGTVLWPEDFGDTEEYLVFGDESELIQRINVVLVPDGYTYGEKATMERHAEDMVEYFRGVSPYQEHDLFLNYILVYAYSNQSGTDECDCDIVRDTAMNTRFAESVSSCGHSDNRCLFYGGGNGTCDDTSTANIVEAELRAPAKDITLVMVNTARYGGCGGSRATFSAANSVAYDIAVHEVGHSLGGLADEYDGIAECGVFAGEINTSTDPVNGAWPEWVAEIGAPRQGAQYYNSCLYRPQSNCEMRELLREFCPVCKQHWALTYFSHPRVAPWAPIETRSPIGVVNTEVGTPVDFSIATRLPSGNGITHERTWTLDGPGLSGPTVVATGVDAYTHSFDASGSWSLEAEVIADTNLIKPSRYGSNVGTASWTIEVAESFPLALAVGDLVRGQPVTLTANGADAGEEVTFLRGSGLGSGPCLPQIGGQCVDILGPIGLLGNAIADAAGTASLTIQVPLGAPLIEVGSQAVIVRGAGGEDSIKSNPTSDTIEVGP